MYDLEMCDDSMW